VAYWQLLYILASHDLVNRLRSEIAPYAQVTKPESIGGFSEAPKLTISHEGFSKKCPLFRATYFEAMRLSARPSSTRKVATDVTISGDPHTTDSPSYVLRKGEYVTASHDLHMRDPKYFEDPESFNPERFLVRAEDGTVSADMRTIRPYGEGPAMCKGRTFAERECLALVAGILVCWDIEPADKSAGWVIPKQKKTSAVCRPVHDTRVRIKPRAFKWDN
jgi:cytochrome P450